MSTTNAPAKIDALADLFGTTAPAVVENKTGGLPAKADTPSGFDLVPYLGFFSTKAKANRDRLVAAGVKENEFYFNDFEPIPLRPARIAIFALFHFFDKVDDDNKPEDYVESLTPELKKQGFADHVLGVALVKTGGGWRGATFSQRKALVNSFTALGSQAKALATDKGASFSARGEKAKLAVELAPFPQFAIVADVWGTVEKTNPDAKGKVWDFNQGRYSIGTANEEDLKGMRAYFGRDGQDCTNAKVEWAGVLRSFQKRRQEVIDALAKKKAATNAPGGKK